MFKRRDSRPWWAVVWRMVWPRGGWGRAVEYLSHRMRRLPDSPERIGRGIWAGVYTAFTPFFGLHFLLAGTIGWVLRGNIFAAAFGTLFGNPLTYLPIAWASIRTGEWILRMPPMKIRPDYNGDPGTVWARIADAWDDVWHNMRAIFGPNQMEWGGLLQFWHDVIVPWTVGSLVPGVIAGTVVYYIAVPILRAYQTRRRKTMAARRLAVKGSV